LVGAHDSMKIEPSVSRHDIAKYNDHPSYKSIGEGAYEIWDYSILDLGIVSDNHIKFRDEARPVYLPESTLQFGPDSKFVVSGWGAMSDHRSDNFLGTADKLRSVTLPYVSEQDCKDAFAEPKIHPFDGQVTQYNIDESMICAGDLKEGKIDGCQGDSGGPMVYLNPENDHVEVIGVVSFGFSCAVADAPGVYADVRKELDWITSQTFGCNQETCSAGDCMTKDKLDRHALRSFKEVTPHRLL